MDMQAQYERAIARLQKKMISLSKQGKINSPMYKQYKELIESMELDIKSIQKYGFPHRIEN